MSNKKCSLTFFKPSQTILLLLNLDLFVVEHTPGYKIPPSPSYRYRTCIQSCSVKNDFFNMFWQFQHPCIQNPKKTLVRAKKALGHLVPCSYPNNTFEIYQLDLSHFVKSQPIFSRQLLTPILKLKKISLLWKARKNRLRG